LMAIWNFILGFPPGCYLVRMSNITEFNNRIIRMGIIEKIELKL
jgi:hypothetical protein